MYLESRRGGGRIEILLVGFVLAELLVLIEPDKSWSRPSPRAPCPGTGCPGITSEADNSTDNTLITSCHVYRVSDEDGPQE